MAESSSSMPENYPKDIALLQQSAETLKSTLDKVENSQGNLDKKLEKHQVSMVEKLQKHQDSMFEKMGEIGRDISKLYTYNEGRFVKLEGEVGNLKLSRNFGRVVEALVVAITVGVILFLTGNPPFGNHP